MNYFAHGRRFVADPYFLAGTAVPDWLNVVDRRVRARAKAAQKLVADADPQVAAIARGIVQHHADDDWFHHTPAFAELSWQFTRQIRDLLPRDDGLRPSFLGHILVEILLDAALIEADPHGLEAYYTALESIDPVVVAQTVAEVARLQAARKHSLNSGEFSYKELDYDDFRARLANFIELFRQHRFLFDYADDGKLLYRLNQVMRRVNLPQLPDEMKGFLELGRPQVARRVNELLNAESSVRQ
jgi:hypothetical protein